MLDICHLRACFVWFYLFGQTTYIPLQKNRDKLLQILSILPKIIFLLISILTPILVYKYRVHGFMPHSQIILTSILSNLHTISNVFAFYLSVRKPFLSRKICGMYFDIVQTINEQLKLNISIGDFAKVFHRKIIFLVIFRLLISIGTFHAFSPFLSSISKPMVAISFIYKEIINLYSIIFIDLMHFVIFMINQNIEKILRNCIKHFTIIDVVHSIKRIHLNIWKVSQILNSNFTSIIVLNLLENFALATFTIFRMFVMSSSNDDTSAEYFIRKYIYILFNVV